MPQTLIDNPDEWLDQTAPLAGEPRTDTSVRDPLQRAANRVAYVKKGLQILDPDRGGVRRIRTRSLLENVEALTAHDHGKFVFVPGYGLYRYDAGDSTPRQWPHILRPENVASDDDDGRWVSQYNDITSSPYGLLRLDAAAKVAGVDLAIADGSGRVLPTHVRNGLMHARPHSVAGVSATSNTTFTEVYHFEIDNYPPFPTDIVKVVGILKPSAGCDAGSVKVGVGYSMLDAQFGPDIPFPEGTSGIPLFGVGSPPATLPATAPGVPYPPLKVFVAALRTGLATSVSFSRVDTFVEAFRP